jgi:hypothetical protein
VTPIRGGTEELTVELERQASVLERLGVAFWALVGMAGLGGPIVDRRSMYGDDPRNDPYRLDFDLIDPPRR